MAEGRQFFVHVLLAEKVRLWRLTGSAAAVPVLLSLTREGHQRNATIITPATSRGLGKIISPRVSNFVASRAD